MCVILFKPFNNNLPSKTILESCWLSNPDGAGIIVRYEDECFFQKGFMSLDDLLTFIDNVKDPQKTEISIHFRLGTSGGISPYMTHPFVVGNVNKMEGKLENGNILLMHNGVIPGLGTEFESDTMVLAKRLSNLDEDKIINTLKFTPGRFLVATGLATYLIGNWIEHENCYYSNLIWKWKMERNYDSRYLYMHI